MDTPGNPVTPGNPGNPASPESASEGGGLNFQIDSDWKAQAKAEKERLTQKASPDATSDTKASGATSSGSAAGGASGRSSGGGGGGGASGGGHELPPASFETLLSSFVTQALFAMGMIPDPQTGRPALHLDLARHQIDLLAVLETKTKGNLSDEESQLLAGTLYELRSRYVQVANAARGA